MNRFIQFTETSWEGQQRSVFVDPGTVCLVQQSVEMAPMINTVIYLNNGEYVQTEEHHHSVLSRLGITI